MEKTDSLERLTNVIESRQNVLTIYGYVNPCIKIEYSVDSSNNIKKLVLHEANFILTLERDVLDKYGERNNVFCLVHNKNPKKSHLLDQLKGYEKEVAYRFASPYAGKGILFTPEQILSLYDLNLAVGLEILEGKHSVR